MFHTVPDEVLEQLLEAGRVGHNRAFDVGFERRRPGRDAPPGLLDRVSDGDRPDVGDRLALPGQRQEVVDEFLHPVQRPLDDRQMLRRRVRLSESEPPACHVQRVPEVVGDDAGELVETFLLTLDVGLVLGAFGDVGGDAADSRDGPLGVVYRVLEREEGPRPVGCRNLLLPLDGFAGLDYFPVVGAYLLGDFVRKQFRVGLSDHVHRPVDEDFPEPLVNPLIPPVAVFHEHERGRGFENRLEPSVRSGQRLRTLLAGRDIASDCGGPSLPLWRFDPVEDELVGHGVAVAVYQRQFHRGIAGPARLRDGLAVLRPEERDAVHRGQVVAVVAGHAFERLVPAPDPSALVQQEEHVVDGVEDVVGELLVLTERPFALSERLCRLFLFGDVQRRPADDVRPVVGPFRDDAEPALVTVAGHDAVLLCEPLAVLDELFRLGGDAVPVVRVDEPEHLLRRHGVPRRYPEYLEELVGPRRLVGWLGDVEFPPAHVRDLLGVPEQVRLPFELRLLSLLVGDVDHRAAAPVDLAVRLDGDADGTDPPRLAVRRDDSGFEVERLALGQQRRQGGLYPLAVVRVEQLTRPLDGDVLVGVETVQAVEPRRRVPLVGRAVGNVYLPAADGRELFGL